MNRLADAAISALTKHLPAVGYLLASPPDTERAKLTGAIQDAIDADIVAAIQAAIDAGVE